MVEDAFVDVQQPDVSSVLDRLGDVHAAVVVPLLLSAGYHVHVDLAREIEKLILGAHPETRGTPMTSARRPRSSLMLWTCSLLSSG